MLVVPVVMRYSTSRNSPHAHNKNTMEVCSMNIYNNYVAVPQHDRVSPAMVNALLSGYCNRFVEYP